MPEAIAPLAQAFLRLCTHAILVMSEPIRMQLRVQLRRRGNPKEHETTAPLF